MDNIPQIDLQSAPSTEAEELRLLNLSLRNMSNFVNNFAAALDLFDDCYARLNSLPPQQGISRVLVPSRDAVMQVWHFSKSMDAANAIANKSAAVGPRLNRGSLGQAFAAFRASFPDFEASRHAVAHAGEMTKNVIAFQKHSFSGTYRGENMGLHEVADSMIQDSLDGRNFTSTHEGKIVKCEISARTLSAMQKVKELFYAGFST